MPAPKPVLYLIAGCNGAGKTTFAKQFLPHEVKCLNFLNADLIAQGLSPLNTGAAAIKAGRLLLEEFRRFVSQRETFALESTLSGMAYLNQFRHAKRRGFQIYLHYLWLPNPTVAIARVHERVKKGGHDVPVADIRRRFTRSLDHFVSDYAPLADRWAVWDSRSIPPKLMAESETCPPDELKAILRAP
ncbi:MAG TPA: AAA family ATPase [Verrucomicrobiae bacterium]|nr:AAA family ATPase [Verrucomicrobiae bacterium]